MERFVLAYELRYWWENFARYTFSGLNLQHFKALLSQFLLQYLYNAAYRIVTSLFWGQHVIFFLEHSSISPLGGQSHILHYEYEAALQLHPLLMQMYVLMHFNVRSAG